MSGFDKKEKRNTQQSSKAEKLPIERDQSYSPVEKMEIGGAEKSECEVIEQPLILESKNTKECNQLSRSQKTFKNIN